MNYYYQRAVGDFLILAIITVVSSNFPPLILILCFLALLAKGDQNDEFSPLL